MSHNTAKLCWLRLRPPASGEAVKAFGLVPFWLLTLLLVWFGSRVQTSVFQPDPDVASVCPPATIAGSQEAARTAFERSLGC
eukprot:6786002-Prymnesium_polylepis.1